MEIKSQCLGVTKADDSSVYQVWYNSSVKVEGCNNYTIRNINRD